ncbi:MAG: TrkH family potassium uptake protein [Prevotella sp.]|nr:TrkH family potassium uptake protein [Prevotella sp.]
MVNFRLISKIIGSLLFIEAIFMIWSLITAFVYGEDDVMAFLMSSILTFVGGVMFLYLGRSADNTLSRRDAYVVVTSTWVVFTVFGTLPYIIHGTITHLPDAFFESMSGFTTTGCSIIDDVERLPHGMLFWRSLTQWIGGLGIVFFTIAILPSLVGGNVKVFAAEATGPMRSKFHPKLSTNAKWIWSIYILLTVACGLSFWGAGMSWFDATNYAMTTTATGGFSTHNDTGAFYQSPMIDYTSIVFQFLSGINFTLLYMALFKRRIGAVFSNSEFKLYMAVLVSATCLIMYLLVSRMDYGYSQAFRSSLFQVVSMITTTGLFNDDVGQWPRLTWVILGSLMFLGACAGSTTGGFKCVRGVMLLKVLRNEFRQILHPNAVLPVRLGSQTVPQPKLVSLLAFFTLCVLMLVGTTTIMIIAGVDNTNAMMIALSCMSNVGPSLTTDIGPQMTWAELSDSVKWMLSLLMLMGRLEIMSVLVLFTREFWKEN